MLYEWDAAKREANLVKHGLDFADAISVFEATVKLTLQSPRGGELRFLDIAEVQGLLIALTLVYTQRDEAVRVISLRQANKKERRLYEQAKNR